MPVTPLHFGPALAVRELIGHKRFGIWSFAITQVAFDIEPVARLLFDLEGTLHQTTHNPPVGLLIGLIAIAATWNWEKWSGLVGAVFGVASHLYLDMLYHFDVADSMAKWGVVDHRGFDAELICLAGFFFWLLFVGIRKAIAERVANRHAGLAGKPDCVTSNVSGVSKP